MPGLRFGVLGTARIARNSFIPGARGSRHGEVHAIASRDEARAQAMASEMGIPRAYGSYASLLEDPDLDAVYIALPNNLHAEWTVAAARAGKHVLCEKPIAAQATEAERMTTACRDAGVVFMEGFMWRHHPQHHRVRELLAEGAIGEPSYLRSSFTFLVNPTTGDHPNVRLQRDLLGGSLMDIGCYGVNAARWAFEAEPEAIVGQQWVDPDAGVDTAFAGVLRFSGGRFAVFDCGFGRYGSNTYTVEGREGSLRVEKAFRPDKDPGRIFITQQSRQWQEEIPPTDQFALEVDHFAQSVEAGHLLPPAEDGVAQARVIEKLYASARG